MSGGSGIPYRKLYYMEWEELAMREVLKKPGYLVAEACFCVFCGCSV